MGTTKISAEMLNEETGLITISSGIYNNRDLFTDVLSSISTAKNVIVDLRTTPGGTQRGVQYFTSQFYSEPTHLSSHIERGFDEPQELWSVDTPVSGEFAEKNIYVLTSHRTGSGAEALSYALKETRGAVLIGEKTAGAGNAGAFMSVGSGMSLFLPISQTISPVTGEPWEGTGVRPHITTIAGSALDVALSTIAKGALPGDEGFGQSDADLAAAIDAYVLGLSASDEFSGAVLVAKDGKVLSSTSVGDADKASGRKNTADTPINLGSTNKMFTGVAIAQLVEKGLLDWQDKVGKYLPDYPNPVVRDSVTIDQLLTHMSGVEAFADQDDFERYRQVTTVAGLMDVISDNPLGFEPGTRYKYSNAGPWILGRIIEVVTGQDYYDYIQANILDPAGMASTGFFRKDDTKADIARGYLKPQQGPRRKGQPMEKASENEAWQPNTDMIGLRGSPSGSAYSSTNDMLKFANALNQNILITADSFKTLTTPRSGENAKDYGYLFRINETNGFRYWGHNGGGPGIQASFMHISALGYTIVVLSNYGSAAMPVSEQIQELLTTSSEG
jgi:CubicO group peptidase (beta-lactamase class C family)